MNSQNYINQLQEILKYNNLSQEELAQQFGVTFAALNRWIQGHSVPHRARLNKIEELHKKTVYYPSIDEKEISDIIKKAQVFKTKGIKSIIKSNEKLQEDFLLEHTYNSTTIEGTTFTKREAELVIFDHQVIEDKSFIEHLEVSNHAAALREIFQKEISLNMSELLIKTINKQLLQGIREDAGEFSRHHRAIRGLNIALTHPKDIHEEMDLLISGWNSKKASKSLLDIAEFHVQFELIHPFGDGNGRVGRLLMAIQCLLQDYPPIVIENKRKKDYYDTLEYAQKKHIGPFLDFLYSELQISHQILQKYL